MKKPFNIGSIMKKLKMRKKIKVVAQDKKDEARARLMSKIIDHQLAEHIGRQVYNIAFAKLMFGQIPPQLDSKFYTFPEDLTKKGGRDNMKKKKSPSKLKLATTAKAKKLLKAKKK